MQGKLRVIGLLMVLVLAIALVPAVAMAAPAITQGVQGVIRDAVTGVPVPFAEVHIDIWGGGGHIDYVTADYDGTYSYELAVDPSGYWISAWSPRHDTSETPAPVMVTTDTVTTQDFLLVQDADTPVQPVYRFFNLKGGVHFYTASDEEFINVYSNLPDFHYDGVAYWVPVGVSENPDLTNPNTLPLYRFFNRQTGVHFYTMSEEEKTTVQNTLADMYTFEGVAYYVTDGDGMPVYRFYVPSRNAHFFTADNSERLSVMSQLSNYYHYEGIGFYIGDWAFDPDL